MLNSLKKYTILKPLLLLFIWQLLNFHTTTISEKFKAQNLLINIHEINNLVAISITILVVILFFLNKYIFKIGSTAIYLFLLILINLNLLFKTQDILQFFINYEFLLLPSAALVYLFSPNKRSLFVTIYFLLWTQLGSFLVFLGVVALYKFYFIYSFQNWTLAPNQIHFIIKLFIFFGFGIKIPIWPFHFWLTKTHVEANTSFSIFLSGVLVKTALVGLLKLNALFVECSLVFFTIIIFGIVDVAMKLSFQIDFKKLTAYLTVQEMGVLTLICMYNNSENVEMLEKFILLHTILSGALFFFNELYYARSGTRQLNMVGNLIPFLPNLSRFFYIILLLFIGLPLTLKFFLEIFFLWKFLSLDTYVFSILVFFFQIVTIIFFLFNTIQLLFCSGTSKKPDLTRSELSIVYILIFYLIAINFI